LAPVNPLNEALHPIPPQIASESYSANQMPKCVFTQPGSFATEPSRRQRSPMSAVPQ